MDVAIIILVVLTAILWLWALIDIARSRFKNPTYKLLWLLAILFFPIVGSIMYFLLKKEFVSSGKRDFDPKFNRK